VTLLLASWPDIGSDLIAHWYVYLSMPFIA
jgi:hypothetical protein